NNLAHTERVQLDTNGATVACLRLDDKIRWCYEHIAPIGARAEMLRIRNEPVQGLLVGQLYHYVVDFDLDGTIDIGSTTRLNGEPHAPVGVVSQFFHRATNRGDQFRGDYQRLYDEGIQIALKYVGEWPFLGRAVPVICAGRRERRPPALSGPARAQPWLGNYSRFFLQARSNRGAIGAYKLGPNAHARGQSKQIVALA